MNLDWLLRDSVQTTIIFAALVFIAVFTQFNKATRYKSMPFALRALLKAAPALFLTWLAWSLGENLVALMFLFCSLGDILLDLPEDKVPHGFQIGAISFAAALVCVCILSSQREVPDMPLVRLSVTNIVIAIFVLRWVLPRLHGGERILEVVYFGLLIVSNVFASTSNVSVFLGSSLWFMSDLSIGLGAKVSDDPVNSLDTLGLYDLGLYFLAIGFLNT
ncbi:MAG TPA: lysoplasmalogenase family protein [Pyrinomonadaceae bacterium]|nr:lysoplasmalogenase family protein [Pyrinomonadaceae bacterium]